MDVEAMDLSKEWSVDHMMSGIKVFVPINETAAELSDKSTGISKNFWTYQYSCIFCTSSLLMSFETAKASEKYASIASHQLLEIAS